MTEQTIPGFDTPRKWVLTGGVEEAQEALLYDWEAVDVNKGVNEATDDNWKWVLVD